MAVYQQIVNEPRGPKNPFLAEPIWFMLQFFGIVIDFL